MKMANGVISIHKKQINIIYLPSILACILLLILGEILASGFLSINNISSILMTAALLTLAAMSQGIIILLGGDGIDLSVGATMSMTALLGPTMPIETLGGFALAVIAVLGMGAVVGALNAFGVQFLRIPPLIMTLVMSSIVYGFTLFVTQGQPTVRLSPILLGVSRQIFPPIRILPAIVIVVVISAELLLHKSRIGRKMLIVGNNRRAAMLCGIKTRQIAFNAYVVAGAIAGFAGFLLVGYAGSAQLRMADNYTLLSVAAVVIGGTKLSGGKGSFIGSALGAMVLVVLNSILQALSMPAGIRALIQGGLLLIILLTNSKSAKLRQ